MSESMPRTRSSARGTLRARILRRLVAITGLLIGSCAVWANPVSAVAPIEWSLESNGGDCIQILGRDMFIFSAAMPVLDVPPYYQLPTGEYAGGSPRSVVEIALDEAFVEAGLGFYLVGFRFVESCETGELDPFEPCFSVSSTFVNPVDPWILSFEPGEYLFFFFDLDQMSATISIDVGQNESDCLFVEDPQDGSSEIDELFDAIEDLDVEFDPEFFPSYSFDFDIERYLGRTEEVKDSLPSTV